MNNMERNMAFWQRFLITVVIVLLISLVGGHIFQSIYLAGIIGGVAVLPAWVFLGVLSKGRT